MRFSLYLILPALAVSCSGEVEKKSVDEVFVSTRNERINPESKLSGEIKGEWHQINKNCNDAGKECVALAEEILWCFKENDVTWGRYTHPYKITNDTLYIAGIPHVIVLNSGDTILLYSVSTKDFMQLVRRVKK